MITAKIFFQGGQDCRKISEGTKLRKTYLKIIKYTSLFFSRFWAKLFHFSEKLPAWFSKLQPTYLEKNLSTNTFWKLAQCFNILRTFRWKIGPLVRKFSSRFLHQEFALPEKFFEGNCFLSRKKFIFLLLFFEFEQFLCLYTKFFSQVSQNTDPNAERKKFGEINLEKIVLSEVFFGNWAEKTWNFSKTVSHNSPNCSLPLQMNTCRDLFGSKTICMKVFCQWTESSDFLRKCFLRIVKGAVHVSSATLRENDD